MLRERFAHRYNRTLFGMYPRNRRGETSRPGEGIGSSLERIGGSIASRRSIGAKVVEAEGAPLVDTEALHAMIRVLRVFQVEYECNRIFLFICLLLFYWKLIDTILQPLYKGQLQKLLLNLCAHNETRNSLVKILMDMLMLDTRKSADHSTAAEPSYRLYACQSNVICSRAQSGKISFMMH